MTDPCNLMRTELRDVVNDMVNGTMSDGLERGLAVYRENGSVRRTRVQTGDDHSVRIRTPSVFGLGLFPKGSVVATVHTHPDSEPDELFSMTDMASLIEEDLEWAAVAYRDRGVNLVTVFSGSGFGSMRELVDHAIRRGDVTTEMSRVAMINGLNDQLALCTVEVGS